MALARYGGVFVLALGAHLAAGWLISRQSHVRLATHLPAEQLFIISFAPGPPSRVTAAFPIRFASVAPRAPEEPMLPAIATSSAPVATPRMGSTTPPHPADSTTDGWSVAYGSGLSHGDATVVLRVQVRASGAVGRVEVDVSGGSSRVDQAAIAYVRSLKWVSGRVDDQPETLWIRWGVRLDG